MMRSQEDCVPVVVSMLMLLSLMMKLCCCYGCIGIWVIYVDLTLRKLLVGGSFARCANSYLCQTQVKSG